MITVNGQLSLCLLVDRLLDINGLKLVAVNTDGVTIALRRDTEDEYYSFCKQWEQDVKLQLEYVEYKKMFIRDVNSYVAVYKE
jgi:hypothetical protein